MKEKNRRNETEVCTVITDRSDDERRLMCAGWIHLVWCHDDIVERWRSCSAVTTEELLIGRCVLCGSVTMRAGVHCWASFEIWRRDPLWSIQPVLIRATQQTSTKCFWLGSFLQKWCFHAVDAWACPGLINTTANYVLPADNLKQLPFTLAICLRVWLHKMHSVYSTYTFVFWCWHCELWAFV